MIGVAMFTTIKTLWEKHKNKSAIAELTGHDWKTVSKVVKLIESGCNYSEKKPHPRIHKILIWIIIIIGSLRVYWSLLKPPQPYVPFQDMQWSGMPGDEPKKP
mgnify:FL=1